MILKACLFDLDGVVVDTAKYHYWAWKEIAMELGFIFSEQHNEQLKGVSRMRSLEILLKTGGVSLDEKTKINLAQKKNAIYLQHVLKLRPDDVLPGAREFLEDCRSHKLGVGLGSASKNVMTILNRLKISQLFDVIVDGNKVTKAKPNPEVFLTGATELGVPPSSCVVFEDAEAGVEAAAAAGMSCVGIGRAEILKKANFVIPGLKHFSVNQLCSRLGCPPPKDAAKICSKQIDQFTI